MADLSKIIKGLECCSAKYGDQCAKCPYAKECEDGGSFTWMSHLAADALELLKTKTGHWVHEPDRVNHWHCSVCGRTEGIMHRAMAYCPGCGAKMEGEQDG